MIPNDIFIILLIITSMIVKKMFFKKADYRFLIVYFCSLMLVANSVYPFMVAKSHMKVFSLILYFLPIILTLRIYEKNKRTMKEKRMRGI